VKRRWCEAAPIPRRPRSGPSSRIPRPTERR